MTVPGLVILLRSVSWSVAVIWPAAMTFCSRTTTRGIMAIGLVTQVRLGRHADLDNLRLELVESRCELVLARALRNEDARCPGKWRWLNDIPDLQDELVDPPVDTRTDRSFCRVLPSLRQAGPPRSPSVPALPRKYAFPLIAWQPPRHRPLPVVSLRASEAFRSHARQQCRRCAAAIGSWSAVRPAPVRGLPLPPETCPRWSRCRLWPSQRTHPLRRCGREPSRVSASCLELSILNRRSPFFTRSL